MLKSSITRSCGKYRPSFNHLGTIALSLFVVAQSWGNGIYRNGYGARGMALGGAEVASPETPLGAMGANPAGLNEITAPTLSISAAGAYGDASFKNSANPDAKLDKIIGVIPEIAFGIPMEKGPLSFGFSVIPEAASSADWLYIDTPGGAGGTTSYGLQRHKSEIILLRTAFGAALKIGDHVSVGASVGLLYNENRLQAPYVFQTQPGLQGVKTLLDLNTSGYGYDAQIGILVKPTETLQLGLSYKTESSITSSGDADGNAYAEFGFPSPNPATQFHYDAEVVNVFPQTVTGGLAWMAHPRLKTLFQVDWINWADGFDRLQVKLKNGSNSGINSGNDLEDFVPLDWQDRFVYRTGLEFAATTNIAVRAGYSYGRNPVPSATLTPMTAAIQEHTVSAGLGYGIGRYQFDLAYQWSIPNKETTGTSQLRAGEYSNSETELGVHWIGVTGTIRF